MREEEVNPAIKAGRKYSKLYNTAEKFAQAAHNHPEIAYEIGETENLGAETVDMTEAEARSDLEELTPSLSNAWQETKQYLMFELEEELEGYLNQDSRNLKQARALNQLVEDYSQLENELRLLDTVVSRVLDTTPSDKFR